MDQNVFTALCGSFRRRHRRLCVELKTRFRITKREFLKRTLRRVMAKTVSEALIHGFASSCWRHRNGLRDDRDTPEDSFRDVIRGELWLGTCFQVRSHEHLCFNRILLEYVARVTTRGHLSDTHTGKASHWRHARRSYASAI